MKNIKNNKGFILLESIIASIFVLGIFTFLIGNVFPLISKYEKYNHFDNLDDVYVTSALHDALRATCSKFKNIASTACLGASQCDINKIKPSFWGCVDGDYLRINRKNYYFYGKVKFNGSPFDPLAANPNIFDSLWCQNNSTDCYTSSDPNSKKYVVYDNVVTIKNKLCGVNFDQLSSFDDTQCKNLIDDLNITLVAYTKNNSGNYVKFVDYDDITQRALKQYMSYFNKHYKCKGSRASAFIIRYGSGKNAKYASFCAGSDD